MIILHKINIFLRLFRYAKQSLLILLVMACVINNAGAVVANLSGVYFESSRLIYPEKSHRGVTVILNNNTDNAFLLQAYLSESARNNGTPGKQVKDFIVTPPLRKLAPHDKVPVRVMRTGGSLPSDRESVLYLTARMIPSGQQSDKQYSESDTQGASLNIISSLSVKVFWRPEGLEKNEAVEKAAARLSAIVSDKTVTLSNPTPYYITLRTLSVGGVFVEPGGLANMIPPFGKQDYLLPEGVKRTVQIPVSWTAIKESGYDTDPYVTAAVSTASKDAH
ncbi:molecular chaperone [Enterobacter asburiae]|nr:molecular chaperone [Enterobacter asburiae]